MDTNGKKFLLIMYLILRYFDLKWTSHVLVISINLVKNMSNLRSLIVRCRDDGWKKKYANTGSTEDELY
jgi:hypothetical protein